MNHLEGLLPILNITPTNYKTGDKILFKKLATLSVLGLTNVAFGDIFFKIPAELLEVNNPPSSMEVINAFSKIEGVQIKGVKFSVDGSWLEVSQSGGAGKSAPPPFPTPHFPFNFNG